MAFDNSGAKAVTCDHPQKRCELTFIFAAIGQAVYRWKALNLGSLNWQYQQDWLKHKKLQLFNFFTRKLRKIPLD